MRTYLRSTRLPWAALIAVLGILMVSAQSSGDALERGFLNPPDGANTLEIKVTNLWVNRLIGDQQPNVTQKITYTAQHFYRADSSLLPSGLIGPVQIVRSGNQ